MMLGIGLRVVAQAQFHWTEVKSFRKLVHGALERHKTDRVAWRAHRIRTRQIELSEAMPREPVRCGVKHARRQHYRFDILVEARSLHQRILTVRYQPAVGIRTQPQSLLRRGTVGRQMEQLRARHRYLHWPAENASPHRGERC